MMEVRTCKNCNSYKFIEENGLCRDCYSGKNWRVVIMYGVLKQVYKRNLTESEAKMIEEQKGGGFVAEEMPKF